MQMIRQIDHTADIGLEITAASLAGIFEYAAVGMFRIIAELDCVQPAREIRLDLRATDVQRLLVAWLSELNFRHIADELVFCTFQIDEIRETFLRGRACGEPLTHAHVIHTEIKAVTYHDLRIERRADGWFARIIFDL